MKLLHRTTGKEFNAEIVKMEATDYKIIKESGQFQFNWSKERANDVYKIIRSGEDAPEILGLLSIVDIEDERRIHINLIESSNKNKGKSKQIDRIAGCLLAYTIQLAFEKGYLGFTSLVPKTALIDLYVEKYGFSRYGRQLAIEGQNAIKLIEQYL